MVSPEAFYASQVRIGDSAAILARRQWRKLGTDLDKWPQVAYRLTLLVSAHQIRAASDGIAYAADQIGNPVATLSAKAYGGWASDGLPLDSLLYGAVVESRTRFGSGMTDQEILLAGQLWLESVVRTQVADAGRVAAGAAITSTPRAEWVRYVNPPCCQNCAILAGKHFRWSQGFQRHPRCDCVHRPVLEDAPDTHTATISPDQIHDLTAAQRQALADGADLNQVVNAYRRVAPSLRTKMLTTAEGTTRRGYASYIRRAAAKMQNRALEETYRNVGRRGAVANYTERRVTARPTPEMIYAYVAKSGGGRAEAVQMLARHGYIVGDIQSVARLGL